MSYFSFLLGKNEDGYVSEQATRSSVSKNTSSSFLLVFAIIFIIVVFVVAFLPVLNGIGKYKIEPKRKLKRDDHYDGISDNDSKKGKAAFVSGSTNKPITSNISSRLNRNINPYDNYNNVETNNTETDNSTFSYPDPNLQRDIQESSDISKSLKKQSSFASTASTAASQVLQSSKRVVSRISSQASLVPSIKFANSDDIVAATASANNHSSFSSPKKSSASINNNENGYEFTGNATINPNGPAPSPESSYYNNDINNSLKPNKTRGTSSAPPVDNNGKQRYSSMLLDDDHNDNTFENNSIKSSTSSSFATNKEKVVVAPSVSKKDIDPEFDYDEFIKTEELQDLKDEMVEQKQVEEIKIEDEKPENKEKKLEQLDGLV